MDINDVIYIVLLILSIGFGYVFKNIEDKNSRKWVSSSIGFLLVLIVSGVHILHPILCTIVCSIIIVYTDKRCVAGACTSIKF